MKPRSLLLILAALLTLFGSARVGIAQSPPPVSFPVSNSYVVGPVPYSPVAADFNGDGKLDLAVTEGNNVAVLLGNGDGTFQPEVTYPVGSTPASIAVGDFNGDGCPDLAVANLNGTANGESISVLLNKCDGSGQFVVSSFAVATTYPRFIAVGDFNGDGNLDLAVADFNGTVWVALGNGDGTFKPPVSYTVGSAYSEYSVAVGYFNADGNLDLAVTTGNGVDVLLGNGDGTFKPPVNYLGTIPTWVAVADFNKDGYLDLALATGNGVDVLLGNGDGTFEAAVNYPAGGEPFSVAVGDFDNDGKLDLAVADQYPSAISVLLGNGNGTFQPPVYFAAGNTPNSVAVGFFTGHSPDLVETNDADATLRVMLNEPPVPITPTNPPSLSQQFVFNSTPTQYLEFDLNYTTAYITDNDLTVQPDTIAMVSNPGVTQTTYASMVAGTSLATTTCYITPAEGTDTSGNPLCGEITLTCTDASNSIPAGDNCPQSLARNLYWANTLETPTSIGGLNTSIPAGYAPTLAMGSDTWSPGNCTFVGPETGNLCPQSMLTQFLELSSDTKVKGGGTGTTSNSTYIAGCCEPEWSTAATVPAWSNSTDVPVSFTASPPNLTSAPGSNNNWVAAPNQSITWGWEALGQTPDPTYPVTGDQTVNNAACPTAGWPAVGTPQSSFTASGNVTVPGDGLYEVHYFSTACDNQEELAFTTQSDPTKNWAAFKTAPFNVDLTKPTVSTPVLSPSPVNGAYLPGQLGVTATVTCVDPLSNGVASGLVQCGKDSVSPSPTPPAMSQASFTSSANPVTIPTTVGPQTFTLTATDQAGNQGRGSVTYQVVGPLASVSTSSINFGTVYLGTITVKSVTVTNVGNAPMTISTPFISILSGGNSTEYFAVSLCPKSLAVEKSCTIYVNFVAGPYYNTPQTALLHVTDNAYGSPQTVLLTAMVINPQAWLSPTSLSFGTVKAEGASSAKPVTLKNTGATALTINSIAIAGANPGDFVETNTCLTSGPPASLAPTASCTINVTFKPTAKGSWTASVVITDNAQNSPQKISLSGTGD